jgi:O-antigen/teichoic acid export membrane protein
MGNGLTTRVLSGAGWVSSIKIVEKILSLLKIYIIARLLEPSDFGLFSAALLVIGAAEVFTRMGFNEAVIHKQSKINHHLHVAYWIQLFRGVMIVFFVFQVSPMISDFFVMEELEDIVNITVVGFLLVSIRSAGLIVLMKTLDFRRYSLLLFGGFIINFITSVFLAYQLRSVWALVIGYIAGEFFITIFSYVAHNYRPKFEFNISAFKEMFGFGIWLFLASLISYISLHADKWVVGKFLTADLLGIYSMAAVISTTLVLSIVKPVSDILKSAYSKIQNDQVKLEMAIEKVYVSVSVPVFPMVVLSVFYVEEIVSLVLGSGWFEVSRIMPILLIANFMIFLTTVITPMFIAKARTKINFQLQLLSSVVFLATVYPLFTLYGLNGIAIAYMIMCLSGFLYSYYSVAKMVDLFFPFIRGLFPAFVSSLFMLVAFIILSNSPLYLAVLVGCVVYVGSLIVFYVFLKKYSYFNNVVDTVVLMLKRKLLT